MSARESPLQFLPALTQLEIEGVELLSRPTGYALDRQVTRRTDEWPKSDGRRGGGRQRRCARSTC
jgi:hypothetical protein